MPQPTAVRTRLRWSRARRRSPLVAGIAAALMAVSAAWVLPGSAEAAEVTDGLVLRYPLDETSGTVAKDVSGRSRDGVVHGTAGWAPGEGLAFNGSDTYVKVPDNLLAGLDSITVDLDVFVDPSLAGAYFIYGFGNTNATNGEGNGYLFTTGDGQFRTAISTGNWSGEKSTGAGRKLARGMWKHITYAQSGTVGILYEDGIQVARNENVTVKPGDIGGGTTVFNHIGRSVYRPDALFKGRIRDFRVYDRAVTADEAAELALEISTAAVERDAAVLTLGDTTAVTDNLKLPVRGAGGTTTITWSSSDPAVVANDGTVTRPSVHRPDATVTLTATVGLGAARQTRKFTVKVLREFDNSQKVTRAVAALVVPNVGDVRGNLTLPTQGANGTTVSWRSDRPGVIDTDGVVRRPAAGSGSIRVNLIATATLNGASASRTFEALVRPLPPKQPLKGYLFSYFIGQNTADQEQIYFALSKGNQALKYRELNGGQPVLRSTVGDKGVRDPFIIRSPEGDKFYQIATDLQIFGNGNWDRAQRQGSRSIVVWESTDLVNWSEPRLVTVSPDSAGNTWAPEAIYDPTLGAYVVFWASKIYPATDPDHTSPNIVNQVMYATTRDFHTFSEARPYIAKNSLGVVNHVIDTTMIEHAGTYYRYTKDESRGLKYSQMVFQQKSDRVLGTFENIGPAGSPMPHPPGSDSRIFNAEGPTIFKSNTEDRWYLLLDDFGGRGYRAYESTDLSTDSWTEAVGAELPRLPRHGTVLPITQGEYDAVRRKYLPGELVDGIAEVKLRTMVGAVPTLPATVTATYADKTTKELAVTWEDVKASAYDKPGAVTVTGTVKESETVRAKATVTVVAPDSAQAGSDVSGVEGSAITLAGTVTGEREPVWTYRAVSGVDGGGTCRIAAPGSPRTSVTCTDDGRYEVTLTQGDKTDQATLTVTNAPPVVGEVRGPTGAVTPRTAVSLSAPVSDPGGNDRLTCTVNWKDGETTAGRISDGRCTASHAYATARGYDVSVTVTDDDGGSAVRGIRVTVQAGGTAGGSAGGTPVLTSGGGSLPRTGFPVLMVAGAGGALLLTGLVLLRVGRGRRIRPAAAGD